MIYHQKDIKTIYIICCWSGQRRCRDIRYINDRTFYIKNHLEKLKTLKQSFTDIILAVSYNPREPKEYRDFLYSLPENIGPSRLTIMDRENSGMSYGALSDVFLKYMTEFEYYFIVEDDGMFCKNNFDKIMINHMRRNPKCGYLCAVAGINMELPGEPYHAMISSGCYKTEALMKFAEENNGTIWPCQINNSVDISSIISGGSRIYWEAENYGQLNISKKMIDMGYKVMDMGYKYKSGFRMKKAIRWFYPEKKEVIFMPI